jgi:hypothetical protein
MSEPLLMPFQDQPFNADVYVCVEFLKLKKQYDVKTAIETGSCLFSTTKWLGENFESVYTAEINHSYAVHGYHRVEKMPNVVAKIQDSVSFLKELTLLGSCIFFLDAHWNDFCPLQDELDVIANMKGIEPPVIVIHDFYTGNEELGYDSYLNQRFDYEWIKEKIDLIAKNMDCEYTYYYNTDSIGAKRGLIYITPQKKQNDTNYSI